MLRKILLPKEEKYFDNFNEMINIVRDMSDEVYNLFNAAVPDKNLLHKLKPLENRCDDIAAKIIKRLNKTFVTPFDREDIFALVKELDDISDMLLGLSVRVDTFNITHQIKYADKLTYIIQQQITEIQNTIIHLREKNTNEIKLVSSLETEADKIYQQAMKELFAAPPDPITLLKEKEILDLLENTCDKCQSTANVIIGTLIKNA